MMRTLGQIIRVPFLSPLARVYRRRAARAIVAEEGRLLMVYSDVNGDYKFPGGGMGEGESPESTLRRELGEECGRELERVLRPYGQMYELDWAMEPEYDVFEMNSFYYWCALQPGEPGSLCLENYERELGFHPVWVTHEEALRQNRTVLAGSNPPRWTERDTRVLELLLGDEREQPRPGDDLRIGPPGSKAPG